MRKSYEFEKRKYVIGFIVCLVIAIYLVRLFILQVTDDRYKTFADSNAFLKKTQFPSRGLIYDRGGQLLVYNQPAYDVMMIMREVQPFDTLDFCDALDITPDDFKKRIEQIKNRRLNPGYSAYTPQVFMSQVSAKNYGKFQEKLYKFSGFYIQNRMLRQYAYPTASNVLGNIREVSQRELNNDGYYSIGDYTGDLGVEKSYEKILRGEKGVEILLRDVHGRIKGKYEDGKFDKSPVSGRNLHLSIDVELQRYGEYLMQNKIGAIVAIEPQTGEILAFVSTPTYDPSLLIGRERGANYSLLNKDPLDPFYDRALMAAYPPGSTFKPTQALTLLQEGIITENTTYPCSGGFRAGSLKVGCHAHSSPLAVEPALQTSCNAFFCYGFRSMLENRKKYTSTQDAFNVWRDYQVSMGYGKLLGVDLPGERKGFIPTSEHYSNVVYKGNYWRATTVISVSIGQGEVLATPLQIANLCATIANRGYFYTPHVVREIQDTVIDGKYLEKHYTKADRGNYERVVKGMRMAVEGGTCRGAALPNIEVCGKTGTAQNPHGRDHSAFIGFAPMDNPKIAIAVYVQNAGFGAAFGVPIGSLMMEKYLTGKISDERKYIEENMVNANTIIYSGIKRN